MKTMYRRKQQKGKVVIVDYDDTILPSTFVDRWKIEKSTDLPLHVSFPSLNQRMYSLRSWILNSFANIIYFLHILDRIQFRNMLEELSRCTERFLEEASKYGEVSLSIACIMQLLRAPSPNDWAMAEEKSRQKRDGFVRSTFSCWWNFFNLRTKIGRHVSTPVSWMISLRESKIAVKLPFLAPNNDWILAPQRPPGSKYHYHSRRIPMCLPVIPHEPHFW